MPGVDKADVDAEARVGLVLAARGFDKGRGVPFGAFARRVVGNHLKDVYNSGKRYAERNSVTLDEGAGRNGPDGLDGRGEETKKDQVPDTGTPRAGSGMEHAETARVVQEELGQLPERVQQVMRGRMAERTLEEIGQEMGISKQAVAQIEKAGLTAMGIRLKRRGFSGQDSDGVLFTAGREEDSRGGAEAQRGKEKLGLDFGNAGMDGMDKRVRELIEEGKQGKTGAMEPGDSVASPEVEARAKKDGLTSAEARLRKAMGLKEVKAEVNPDNARLMEQLEALDPKEPALESVKEKARGVVDWVKRLGREMTDLPPDDPYKRSINRYTAKLQASELEVVAMAKHLVEAVPDALAREGITNWRVAQGDEGKLRMWAELSQDPKLKAGYEAALRLTPEQKQLALDLNDYYKSKLALGQERGMLENGVQNYASQIWRDDKGKKLEDVPFADVERDASGAPMKDDNGNFIQKIGRKFSQGFQFANPRQFDDFFSGESMGFRPLTKDAASLLGIYGSEFNRTVALREFVKELTTTEAADGRPIVGVGVSQILRGVKDGETPDLESGAFHIEKPENSAGFKTVNHPVFERWKFTVPEGEDSRGGAEAQRGESGQGEMPLGVEAGASGEIVARLRTGNLTVHPDYEKRLNNLVGDSKIREWYNSQGSALAAVPKAIMKGIDWGNKEVKGLTFVGSPFHLIHLAKRSLGYQINPFQDLPSVDTENPLHRRALLSGLMVAPDHNGLNRWLEGLGGNDSRLAEKIPIARDMAHYCFENYIPRLKMKAWTTLTERMLDKYKGEIAAGKVSTYQVENYAANIANNAFGHLNYAELGRSPTVQHLLSFMALAPDFTESTLRHLGDAAKGVNPLSKVGGESAKSIAVLALGTLFIAKTLNKLIDGEWHMDHPFSIIVGNREYSVRSQVADIQHMYHDWRGYLTARMSPVARTLWQGASGKNYRGESMGWTDQARDLVASWIPATLRALPGLNQVSPTDAVKNLEWYEQFAASMGFKIARYSPSKDVNKWADEFLQAKGQPSMQGAFQPSKYRALRNALADNKLDEAKDAYRELLKDALEDAKRKARAGVAIKDPLGALENGFRTSVFHPIIGDQALQAEFLRGLSAHQREIFKESLKDRVNVWGRFQKISGSGKMPPVGGGVLR